MSLDEVIKLPAGVLRTHRFELGEAEEIADEGLTLAGTPVVTATPAAGLTIGSPAISGTAVAVDLTPTASGTYALQCVCPLSNGKQVWKEGTLYVP